MKVLDPNIFPSNYVLAISDDILKEWWPNLTDNDFEFKSVRTTKYNCLAWAIRINTQSVEMFYFQKKHGLDPNNLDHSVNGYAKILEQFYGFEVCDDGSYEEGFEKILLYGDHEEEWTHAARLVKKDLWVSKLGGWEDIEHTNVDCLNGVEYGSPKLYMRKKLIN